MCHYNYLHTHIPSLEFSPMLPILAKKTFFGRGINFFAIPQKAEGIPGCWKVLKTLWQQTLLGCIIAFSPSFLPCSYLSPFFLPRTIFIPEQFQFLRLNSLHPLFIASSPPLFRRLPSFQFLFLPLSPQITSFFIPPFFPLAPFLTFILVFLFTALL